VAAVFGANANTQGTVDVRSGSDVLLSGQSSEGFDDPILEFDWQQINVDDYQVTLYERTSNAVVFEAPEIPITDTEGVTLDFQLTVTDADGATATDTVQVVVKPALDANHFLSRPENNEEFIIVVAADSGTTLTQPIPVSIEITQTVSWIDRENRPHQLVLNSETLSGVVPQNSNSDLSDPFNLYFRKAIPLLDIDDVNQNFQNELRDQRLEFENVDTAQFQLSINLLQQATGNLQLGLAKDGVGSDAFNVIDTTSVASGLNTLAFDVLWLQQQVGMESRISGDNYYKCIDPFDQATTLNDWIQQAGFNDDLGDEINAIYLNNYDLNFGRNMFLRQDDNGNVYSYVTNAPSLENSLSGRNEFAVVVMEFSPAPTGNCGDGTFEPEDGKKIVKFYAYVPDEATGDYVRAATMNFDGRGERALPSVCIACHFGDYDTESFNVADYRTISADFADLDSSFMIWDLDAFLYTANEDVNLTDPIYASNVISDDITERYSRSAQEDAFRGLNQAVLHTFTYDVDTLKRFESPIKLLHGFYGNGNTVDNLNFGTEEQPLNSAELTALKQQVDTLPENDFDGENYTPIGWENEPALYHNVYARNCRLCHAQIGETTIDFDSYEEFINNERLVNFVYEQGLMPLSRLTMDRFWSDFYDGQSAAEYLRDHLNSDNNPNNDVAADLRPGTPVAVLTPESNAETAADVILDFDETQLFDATSSLFSDDYRWRVNDVFQSSDSKFVFSGGIPGQEFELSLVTISSENFVTSQTETRSILIRNNDPNIGTLPAQTVNEGDSLTIDIYEILCPGESPDSGVCRPVFGDINLGATPTIVIAGDAVNASVDAVNSATGEITFTSTASEAQGDASFQFTLSDSFGQTSAPARIQISVNSLDGPSIGSPDTCIVQAKSFATESSFPITFNGGDCVDPSLNDTVADGLTLSIVSVDSSDLQSGASVELLGGDIQYEPGRFFTGQDSFTYTVQDSSLSAKTSTGTVLVTVQPTQTFASLTAATGPFGSSDVDGCAACHDGSLAGAGAPNWFNAENVRLAATNDNNAPYGAAEIALAEPTTTEELLGSILFRNACNSGGTHTGGNRLCLIAGAPSSVGDLNSAGQAILRWLEEGASD